MTLKYYFSVLVILFSLLLACTDKQDDNDTDTDVELGRDLTDIPYAPQPYELDIPRGFNPMPVPPENPLTVDGVELGRHLFYDKILSADGTQSCASCHRPELSFTDGEAVSVGIDGIAGRRSSMSLLNIGYSLNGLFWDGSSPSLEAQALLPVEDPIELHNTWPNVEQKLREHDSYPEMFRRAFGIDNSGKITKELATKAIASFERTLISSGESAYDRAVYKGSYIFSDDEQAGYDMYFDFEEALLDAECGHCHTGFLLTINEYRNNGLVDVGTDQADLNNFPDKGRGEVTGILGDNGKMRIPTLRNIALTAPYMHDGRFETLEEVLDHYNSGGHNAWNEDPLIYPFFQKNNPDKGITEKQKEQIIAFLHTLTDTVFTNNPVYQDPFDN